VLEDGRKSADEDQMGALDPAIGGDFVVDVIEGARDQDIGKAIRKDTLQPW